MVFSLSKLVDFQVPAVCCQTTSHLLAAGMSFHHVSSVRKKTKFDGYWNAGRGVFSFFGGMEAVM